MNVRQKTCKSPPPTTNPGTKTKPDADDEAIELTVREWNLLLEGIDLRGNQPHKVLTPHFWQAMSRHFFCDLL
jgi:hypothetical protein